MTVLLLCIRGMAFTVGGAEMYLEIIKKKAEKIIILFYNSSNIQAVTQISETTPVQMRTEQQLELNQQLSFNVDNYCGLDYSQHKRLPFWQYMRPLAFSSTCFVHLHFPIHKSILSRVWPRHLYDIESV